MCNVLRWFKTKLRLSIRIGSCVSGSGSLWVVHFVLCNFPFLLPHFNIIIMYWFSGGRWWCAVFFFFFATHVITRPSFPSPSAPALLTRLLLFSVSSRISLHPRCNVNTFYRSPVCGVPTESEDSHVEPHSHAARGQEHGFWIPPAAASLWGHQSGILP